MFVLLGANGNISAKLARLLLAQRQPVRVIGRRAANLAALQAAGAEIAIGDAADVGFLTAAFKGARGVYAMIPPNYGAPDPRAEQARIGEAISRALSLAAVRRVVNLSSGGADLPAGTGPIAGLHDQEQRLNRLPGLSLLHLRPAYFFENHLHAAGLIKAFDVYPSMEQSDVVIPMVATRDIATAIARELQDPGLPGSQVLHLRAAGNYTMQDAARILGAAIGKPGLKHVRSSPAEAKAAMIEHGISLKMADLFEEMAAALSDGRIAAGFANGPTATGPTSLEDFAPQFAEFYRSV